MKNAQLSRMCIVLLGVLLLTGISAVGHAQIDELMAAIEGIQQGRI